LIYSLELTSIISSLAEPEADGENDDDTLGDEQSEPFGTSDYTYTGGTGTPIDTNTGATEANREGAAIIEPETPKGNKRKDANNALNTNLGANTTADGDASTPTTGKGNKTANKRGRAGRGN